ncbi:helix-turn-helix domain containing protein [Streptomyces coeruleorubidus]|uniref:TetR/AcrR family transcriptional regulator n=1 Tax=Streptomyces coeruleorubidus TaxID=116188 RepID=UPI00237F0EF2|nr:TetR/AcrR family transcriptional regulator [Streptomyces coeruleorubidus]WDV53927.1 helix-turn-helix domain containing protein [Streptomyces coeruleorubidus]
MENARVTGGGQKRAVGRPRRIEAGQIVDVTRRIIQEEGVEAVSMRRVAKEVGATPMALYHHVRDKDQLLMLVLSGMAAQVPRPDLPEEPRDRLLATAVHMYAVLSEMTWVVDVLSLGDLTDKGALWMTEEIIDCAIRCGLTPRQAVHAYRTVWYVVHGTLVFRRADERRAASDPGRRPFFPSLVTPADAAELPRLAALSEQWEEITGDYDVAAQLAAVVDGLLGHR